MFDTIQPNFSYRDIYEVDWYKFYHESSEFIPPNVHDPRGDVISLNKLLDASHVVNLVTRRYNTGIFVFGIAPIIWYSNI